MKSEPFYSPALIPKGVWALGFVSMLMDISSEMIHALLPLYLVTGLGASMFAVGLIEGIAEATASITKIFSGSLSDWLGKRKMLVALGYGLAAFTKPVFPLSPTIAWLVGARFVDRIGKGIRGAPRDALIADISPIEVRGASFGLRQSLDTVGAFLGPLIAIGLMWWTASNFRLVFWFAVIPAFLALALVIFTVKEPKQNRSPQQFRNPLSFAAMLRLGPAFWQVTLIGIAFTLARFSEAFLILRAQSVGLAIMWGPLILIVINVVYSLAAYPVGALSDRLNRKGLLAIGLALLIVADLTLALLPSIEGVMLGVVLWGLHMGFTQGLLTTLVADASPADSRGTAFGYFNLFTGIAVLVASAVAGLLWDKFGPSSTYLAGIVFASLALAGLVTTNGATTKPSAG